MRSAGWSDGHNMCPRPAGDCTRYCRVPLDSTDMGRLCIALLIVVGLLFLPSASFAASGGCVPARAKVVKADKQAVVYTRAGREGPVLWGCSRATGRSHRLGEPEHCSLGPEAGECEGLELVVLAGEVVAFGAVQAPIEVDGVETNRNTVGVRSVRTGRLLFEVPDGEPTRPELHWIGIGGISSLVAKPDGSIAWIAIDEEWPCEPNIEVCRSQLHANQHGRSSLLAASALIGRRSLRLKGSLLTWREAGHERNAELH